MKADLLGIQQNIKAVMDLKVDPLEVKINLLEN